MVGFAVFVGIAVVVHGNVNAIVILRSLLGFLTGFSISSFSMITNDVYDYEVDKINQPSRPLPSGRITLGGAKTYAIPFLLLGLIAALTLGLLTLAIAGLFAFIGWYYNCSAKKSGLFGNSLVAISLAIPYIYGSIAAGNYSVNLAYLLALTSFLAGLGREVLKGIADIAGDKIRNIRSVAIAYGTKNTKLLSALFFLAAVVSSTFPIVFGLLGHAFYVYVILILLPDAIFLYLPYRTLTMKVDVLESLKLKSIALLGMLLGLLADFAAGLFV